ncbi:MAG TPA: alpha/beta hydrolase [Burkholderiaceae bacterium]|nr:alpha/beta hydrolase [Burkholderiaceae bacterium]
MNTNTLSDRIEIETAPNPTHAIIWLHGLGADGNDFAPIVPELRLSSNPRLRFVFPHAPVRPVSINGGMPMRAWYDILTPDLVRREDDQGIRDSEALVRTLIERENARGISTENLVLAGFSQGCAMALHTGLRLDHPLAGIMGLSGYLPLADTVTAERHTANQNTPIFLAHGTLDPVVVLPRAQASHQRLTDMGYDVHWKTYPMPHSVCPQEIADIADFLNTVLK